MVSMEPTSPSPSMPPPVRPATFLPVDPIPSWKPWLLGLGGVAALGFGGLMFLIRILTPPEVGSSFVVFLAGFLACFFLALGAFYQLFQMLWNPHRVELGAAGLRLLGPLRDRSLPWQDIGWLETTQVGGGAFGKPREAVCFVDPRGRKLATVTDALAGFEVLVERSRERLGERARRAARDAQLSKLRRSAVLSWVTAAGLAAAVIFIAVSTWQEHRAATTLERDGVETEARLERHYVHFVTPRVEAVLELEGHPPYRHGAAVTQEAWDALEGQETVRVRYVPTDPSNLRLANGELDLDVGMGGPVMTPILLIAGTVMVFGLVWLGRLQRQGKDLRIDPETRRWRLVRVVEE